LAKKNLVISPRALNTSLDPNAYASSTSTKNKVVSHSLALNQGSFKEAGASFIDRLTNQNSNRSLFLYNFVAGMKVHKGPFHMNSISTKNPKYLISELTKAVEAHKIYHRNVRIIFQFFL